MTIAIVQVLTAGASAVEYYDENLNEVAVLKNSVGLIRTYDTEEFSSGNISKIVTEYQQQGLNGGRAKIRERQYWRLTSGNNSRLLLVKDSLFQSNSGDLAPASTVYAYSVSGLVITQRTTTWPTVTSAQNGSNTPTSRVEVFDTNGQLTELTDERGVVTHYTYNPLTGALALVVQDVGTGELNLTTNYESDAFGRITQELGPIHSISLSGTATSLRRAKWTVYKDGARERWEGQGYATGSGYTTCTLLNPVQVTKMNGNGAVTDQIVATRSSTSGKLSPSDSFAQSTWVRWHKIAYDDRDSTGAHRGSIRGRIL